MVASETITVPQEFHIKGVLCHFRLAKYYRELFMLLTVVCRSCDSIAQLYYITSRIHLL